MDQNVLFDLGFDRIIASRWESTAGSPRPFDNVRASQARIMSHTIKLRVNGHAHELEIAPETLLVELLREHLRLTGTHVGCDTSQCGCCVVLVDGLSVKSCTMLAVSADGCEIETVEGLADGDRLSALQRAFNEQHALQCGFCTPGVLMSVADLLARNPEPSEAEIRKWLEGNLCRCTGYHNIVKAVRAAARMG